MEDREQLDAHRSPNKPKTYWEEVADKYNDPDYAPVTRSLENLHSNFIYPMELLSEDCPKVTPQKVKSQFQSSRAKLTMIIANYKNSGSGHGQYCSQMNDCFDGSDRANFLAGVPGSNPHLLYMREVFDSSGILEQSLDKISDNLKMSSSEENRMVISYNNHPRKKAKTGELEEEKLKVCKQYVHNQELSFANEKKKTYIDFAKLVANDRTAMNKAQIQFLEYSGDRLVKEAYKSQYEEAKKSYEHTYKMFVAML